jgi:hypothetical protein
MSMQITRILMKERENKRNNRSPLLNDVNGRSDIRHAFSGRREAFESVLHLGHVREPLFCIEYLTFEF